MIYPIYIYGSGVLRAECSDITPDYPELDKLVEDMFETMYASNGVGLAAPQIGKDIALVVIDASPMAGDDPSAEGFKRVLINPEIVEESDVEVLMNEGCLSVPGIHEDIYRPEEVTVRYMDQNWQPREEHLGGWPARVVQHELDHLDGMVFTDHLSALRKTLLRNKLTAMSKGKYDASYRTRLVK